jgi:hypothetical protein
LAKFTSKRFESHIIESIDLRHLVFRPSLVSTCYVISAFLFNIFCSGFFVLFSVTGNTCPTEILFVTIERSEGIYLVTDSFCPTVRPECFSKINCIRGGTIVPPRRGPRVPPGGEEAPGGANLRSPLPTFRFETKSFAHEYHPDTAVSDQLNSPSPLGLNVLRTKSLIDLLEVTFGHYSIVTVNLISTFTNEQSILDIQWYEPPRY